MPPESDTALAKTETSAPSSLEGELLPADVDQELKSLRSKSPLRSTDIATSFLRQLQSDTSRRTYETRLNQAADAWGFVFEVEETLTLREQQALRRTRYVNVPWHQVRVHHIRALTKALRDAGKKYTTINLTVAAVRGVCGHAFELQLINSDDLKRIERVKPQTGTRLPTGRHVKQGEIHALAAACFDDKTHAGCRDSAIFALLYGCGLRRREVASLRFSNLKRDDREIQFVGKRNKERKTYPPEGVWNAINAWLKVRGTQPGPLFHPINKSGEITTRVAVSEQAIYNAVVKRIKQAALPAKTTPHDLRRSFATKLLKSGKDLKLVSDLMGHASVDTTALYDHRDDIARKEAQQAIHWPTF